MPFNAYGFFTKFAIKLIACRPGMRVKASHDYDLTDYRVGGIHRPFRGERNRHRWSAHADLVASRLRR
jgi:hypothetical protein